MEITQQNLSKLEYFPNGDYWKYKLSPRGRNVNSKKQIWGKAICKSCGKDFLACDTSERKYCSYKCFGEFKHKQALLRHGIMETKRCSKCGKLLSVDEFILNKSGGRKDQYKAQCRSCCQELSLNWRNKNPIRSKALIIAMRIKKRNKGLGCDIDYQWIYDKFSKGFCEVTGIPFVFQQTGRPHRYSPSIDRINSKKGYIKDNCRAVVWILNRGKGDDLDEDFEDFIIRYAESIRSRKN